ncbi:hypothetical protein Scep_028661 [Stephania cephalantha]|uniref:Zinc knuckle CX2CX4HX4C domain-containing protein n=1 Tax=Stephania cephalantha TaxID=152367 RepID=A0AAP0HJT7_9MAGN
MWVLNRGQSDEVAKNPLAPTGTGICTQPSQKGPLVVCKRVPKAITKPMRSRNPEFKVQKSRSPEIYLPSLHINNCKVWVQLHGLPIDCRGEESVREITKHISRSIRLDEEIRVDEVVLERYSHFRVEIDVDKPLQRGRIIHINDRIYLIDFVYKRFKFVCHYCGKVTHKTRACDRFMDGVSKEVYDDSLLANVYRKGRPEFVCTMARKSKLGRRRTTMA